MQDVPERELDRFHDMERDGWRRLATGYARYLAALMSQAIDPLLDAAGVGPGSRVLDLCCGPGLVSEAVRQRGGIPLGIDFAPEMVAIARSRWPDIAFREGDAEALELPDRSFDAVVMNFGLLHLARPEMAMNHVARVLKPGGRVACTVWDQPEESVGTRIMLAALNAHGKMDVGLPAGPPLFRFSDEQESRRLFDEAGLTDARFGKLRHQLDVPAPDGLFDAFIAGAVRISVILARQTPEALGNIRRAVQEACAPYERDGMLRIPMASVLASAKRP